MIMDTPNDKTTPKSNERAAASALSVSSGSAPKCEDEEWVGHEWKMRGFYSDACIHCGTVAVEGINGMKKNGEHCQVRANLLSQNKN